MDYLEDGLVISVVLYMPKSVSQTEKTGLLLSKRWTIKLPDYLLQLVKLHLVFRQPEESVALARKLTKGNGMMLEVRNKESQLVAEAKERAHACLVSRHRELRES